MRKKLTALVAAGVALGLGAGLVLASSPASAVLSARVGTFTDHQTFVRGDVAWVTGSAAYLNVPGAAVSVVVPAGTTRLIDARFTAESACSGTSGWCTVRIVYVTSTGGVGEMQPAVGTDFAFDSTNALGNDLWESHAIERSSYYLGPGTYRVLVQAAKVGAAASLRLDDWHLVVEVVRP